LRPTREAAVWRRGVQITALEGRVVVHRETGVWSSMELTSSFSVREGSAPVSGQLWFKGAVELLESTDGMITPPPNATPTPERVRYEPEKRALLDGLAAP
jgi:hypothetical protein